MFKLTPIKPKTAVYRTLLHLIDRCVEVPHTPKKDPHGTQAIEIPNFILKQLDAYAERSEISRTDAIASLLSDFEKEDNPEAKEELLSELKALQENLKK